jgi:hypothetical protein
VADTVVVVEGQVESVMGVRVDVYWRMGAAKKKVEAS